MNDNTKKRDFSYKRKPLAEILAAQRGGDGGNSLLSVQVPPYKANRAGEHRIRFLPPTGGAESPLLPLFYYYDPTARKFLVAPETHGADSPPNIAALRTQLFKEGNKELGKQLFPRKRVMAYIINRVAEGPTEVMFYDAPQSVGLEIAEIAGELTYDDPEKGYDLAYRVTGEKFTTKYLGIAFSRDATPLHADPAVTEKLLDFAVQNPLLNSLKTATAEEFQMFEASFRAANQL